MSSEITQLAKNIFLLKQTFYRDKKISNSVPKLTKYVSVYSIYVMHDLEEVL